MNSPKGCLPKYPGVNFTIDWTNFLSQHDIIFQKPMPHWRCGAPIGNGDLTATTFESDCLEWGISKLDVWDNRFDRDEYPLISHKEFMKHVKSKDWEKLKEIDLFEAQAQMKGGNVKNTPGTPVPAMYPACPPQPKPCGRLRIRSPHLDFSKRSLRFNKRISLYDAAAISSIRRGSKHVDLISFVDAERNVLVVKCTSKALKSPFEIELVRNKDEFMETSPVLGSDGKNFWVDYVFPDGFRYVMMAMVVGLPYEIVTSGNSHFIRLKKAGKFTIYLTVVTSNESSNPLGAAKANLRKVKKLGFNTLYREHTNWWHDFWQKSFINIPDKFLENLWYYHLYILASCSRSSQPPALLGPWHVDDFQGWHGDYHGDVNIQMTYWPIFTSNHVELGAPYFTLFKKLLPRAKREAKNVYGMRGAKYPGATFLTGEELASLWFRYLLHINAWYVESYWWHWLYTKDKKFLKDVAYDVIREIALFYIDYLQKDENGKYYVFPSNSPEQGEWWIKNPTIDLALIKQLLTAANTTSEVLARDAKLRKDWQNILNNLSEYPNDGNVFLDYDGAPADSPLCHPALLAPVFPAGDVGPDGDKRQFELAMRTLEELLPRSARKIEGYPIKMPIWDDDMTWPWIACVAARLGRPDLCLGYIYDLGILLHLKPNGLFTAQSFSHGMPEPHTWRTPVLLDSVLNSGTGLVTSINEMLLQSYDGKIRVFPAVPGKWSGRFANLRAVGAFLVSSEMNRGKTRYVIIESEKGGICDLTNPWQNEQVAVTDVTSGEKICETSSSVISFKTHKHHMYHIAPLQYRKISKRVLITGKKRRKPRAYAGPTYLSEDSTQELKTVYLGLTNR